MMKWGTPISVLKNPLMNRTVIKHIKHVSCLLNANPEFGI